MKSSSLANLAVRTALLLLGWAAVTSPAAATQPTLRSETISLVVDPRAGGPAQHGIAKLTEALRAAGWYVEPTANADVATGGHVIIAAVGAPSDAVARAAGQPAVPSGPEALSVTKFSWHGKSALLLAGADDRGLMYAALDSADRVSWVSRGSDPFLMIRDTSEHPFVRDRSLSVYTMNRAHWESRFYDERYWTRYFDLLAADRFNRFLIVFGYENGGFLAPPYPYFFNTPGFAGVHMVGLTAAEQTRNLTALNRLIELAHERGIAVSLGIWDHIYRAGVQTGGAEWLADYKGQPVPNTVEGVTSDNLSAYTLASLKELLARVPKLDGLQFRIHEESGLKREEMDGFWRAVFTHLHHERPDLLVEARAKGTPDSVLATAEDLGLNLRVETKYWMEQMGLPFHPTHVNPPNQHDRRHGYADLLRYPQHYQIDWRLWNGGTTRVLLWGDPEYVRRYSLSTQLYQSPNWDIQEPLATKMEAQRPDMPDFDLMPPKYRYYDYEFERYWHFYQVWGRYGYNPEADRDIWQHEFNRRFGSAGADVAAGLHRASEVLPMIVAAVYPYRLFPTTRGWAERQTLGARLQDYAKNEGTDTELFESFAAAAQRIASGSVTAMRTPDLTSRWFNTTADQILASVSRAEAVIGSHRGNEFDSTMTDLRVLAQLARFHAHRALAAVHYNLYLQTNHPAELVAATAGEHAAVAAWRALVTAAGDRYNFDLAMGARDFDLCGHWRDELPKLDADLADLEHQCAALGPVNGRGWAPNRADDPEFATVEHERVQTAQVGKPLSLRVRVTAPTGVAEVRVRYRHVTQFEDYSTLVLQPAAEPGVYTGTIPGDAVSPGWDFMYFIEAIDRAGHGTHWPDPLKETPYVIVKVAHDRTQ